MNSNNLSNINESNFLQTSRALTLIDDKRIRSDLFAASASLIRKIKQIEEAQKYFQIIDKQVFENWFNLTFRQEIHEKERLEKKKRNLLEFQTHLQYLTDSSKITYAEAFHMLYEEERQYREGDQEWRFIVDKLRQQRLDCALKRREEAQEGSFFRSQTSEGGDAPDPSRLDRQSRSLYGYCKDLNDENLKKLLTENLRGSDIFRELLSILIDCADSKLLGRIWKLTSEEQQTKVLEKVPPHLIDFINEMITHDIKNSTHTCSKQDTDVALEVEIKTIYRRLARKLHPDTFVNQDGANLTEQVEKLWRETQDAYKNKNLKQLKRIEILSIIFSEDLQSLTLDEIYQSSFILTEELERLNKALKTHQRHPAWKFSTRKAYRSLAERLRADLQIKLRPLKTEVEELDQWIRQLAGHRGKNENVLWQ